MLRSEMKKGMYVRIKDELDESNFWSRLLKGRVFQIDRPAIEPDDAKMWSQTSGTLINYGMNYVKSECNTIMTPLPEEQQERMAYIFANKSEFKDMFRLGSKIERQLEELEGLLSDVGAYDVNLYDISDKGHLMDEIYSEMECDLDEEENTLDDIKDLWVDIESNLDELTLLEDKHVRGIKVEE